MVHSPEKSGKGPENRKNNKKFGKNPRHWILFFRKFDKLRCIAKFRQPFPGQADQNAAEMPYFGIRMEKILEIILSGSIIHCLNVF